MSGTPLSVAFAGTPEFAACALRAILAAGHRIPLVLTQPDRPAKRGMKLVPSAVKEVALAHDLPLAQPARLRSDEERAPLRAAAPDVLVVAAYGLLLPPEVLTIPRLGCFNIHASLLPRWRGAAPIHRAIEAGDSATGITIMQMDEGLDTGAMLASATLPIAPNATTGSLHDQLASLGAELICQTLDAAARGPLIATAQPTHGVTYAAKISKQEAVIDWQRPAVELERQIRALDPAPGVHATLHGVALKLWRARVVAGSAAPGEITAVTADSFSVGCGEGLLEILEVQKPGGRRLAARDFLRGQPLQVGERFTLTEM